MKKIFKYGKSSQELISIKEEFFNNNEILSKLNEGINKIYSNQPERLKCKNCNFNLFIWLHFNISGYFK